MAAEHVEGELAAAVDDAVLGDVLDGMPEAQPDRVLVSATDVSSLYVRHRSGLAAHARRFLRDSRDVDEVVQETFLRVFLAIDEIETELQAIAFARRTLTNLCIDRYRADRRRPALVDLDSAPVGDLSEDWSEDDPVLRAEDAAVVREALAQLSPLHRAALVKREIEEKPLSQIAVELDVPEESVKHLLFRARRALRRLLVGTSVEPGVDLTVAEAAAIANRRAGTAILRGANVFIVLVVGAIVAAVGVRTLEGRSAGFSGPSEAFGGSAPVTASAIPNHPSGGASTHHGGGRPVHHPGHNGSSVTSSLPVVVPVEQAPITHHPVKPSSGFGAARSHFKLSGPLKVRGTPHVASDGAFSSDGGVTTTAASSFTALTDQGTFQLAQKVSRSQVDGDAVIVTPSFVVGNVVEAPTMTGSTASVSTGSDGSVSIDVTASTQADPTTNAFPLTSVTVHLMLSADLSDVLAESVVLSTNPPQPTPAPIVASPTPPTVDGVGGSGSGGPGPTTGPTGGGDTTSGGSPDIQAGTTSVLEISDVSGDDPQGVGSF